MSDQTPLISSTAFACPHCGAFAAQKWYQTHVQEYPDDNRVPNIPDREFVKMVESDQEMHPDAKADYLAWSQKMQMGLPYREREQPTYLNERVQNLSLSECFTCNKIAVWVHDNYVFPPAKKGPPPNVGMPENVRKVFEEARSILGDSPRGAAALLRLCVQLLCAELGEKGKNIDADIASLVGKGLSVLVQQSLDVVRVIGNESIHPGVIDLNDDRPTAEALFVLVNSITEQMITHPRAVSELYSKLPEGKRKAIEERNAKAKK
jgi:Domain of unknown function (DUF4145)